MPFPATITNDAITAPGSTSFPGPLQVGTTYYVFPFRSPFPNNFLNCYKSIDGGNTWTQVGGDSGAVEVNTLSSSVVSGTKIYTVCVKPGAGPSTRNIQVIAFDTVTDTWVAPVDTGNTQGIGGLSNAVLPAAYRASDNSIIVCTTQTNATPLRMFYFVYDINSATAGPQIACGETGVDPNDWNCRAVLSGNGFTHFFFTVFDGAGFVALHTQALSDAGALGAVQLIDSSAIANSPCYVEASDGTTVCMGWAVDVGLLNPTFKIFSGASADPVVFTEQDYTYTNGLGFLSNTNGASLARDGGITWLFLIGSFGNSNDGYVQDSGSGFGAFTDLGDNDYVIPYSQPLSSVGLAVIGNLGFFFYLFTAAPATATLTLVKSVSSGGQAVATDFILSAHGPIDLSGAGGFGPTSVPPGTYSLAETVVAGYHSRSWSLAGSGTLVGDQLTLAASDVAVVTIVNDPIQKPTAGGGVYFPRFVNKTLLKAQIARIVGNVYRPFAPLSWLYDFPNGNDICLSREWRLYNQIDPVALSCARKPDCFTGENTSRPWVEAPAGAVTFNPDKAIPLPDPATVNAVIFSFRVPIGFDGILLAQYHAYTGAGVFIEGSGDIVWRVRVNNRYLRDMGNMQVSIGSPQTLSPCPGGLWLYSGNLVEYVVSAPNGSGSLPLPGQGNILAGLHGWFYPRI